MTEPTLIVVLAGGVPAFRRYNLDTMIRRVGFRGMLPIANLLLYVVLIGFGDRDLFRTVNLFHDINATAAPEGSWEPIYIDRPMPLTHVLATAINFPAVLFAIPFGRLAQGWRGELFVNSVAALYLIPLWYVVGGWLDRRHRPVRQHPALTFLRRAALLVAMATAMLFGALLVAAAARNRGADDFAQFIVFLPVFFWPGFLGYAAWSELRAARSHASLRVEIS